MRRYKLVTQDYKTRKGLTNETTWEIGTRVEAAGEPGGGLCTDSFVHCYDSPELAALLNSMHANIDNPRMLVVKTHGRSKNDSGLKRGYRAMTPIKEIPCPQPTLLQRIAFGILCAKPAYTDRTWNAWADAWLSGEDRSCDSARAAADHAAAEAAYAYVYDVSAYAARAARAAADHAAAYDVPAHAASAATYAARAAAHAAAHAAASARPHAAAYAVAHATFAYSGAPDFVAIAKEAMTY